MKRLLLIVLLALALPVTASASLQLQGDITSRHSNWARLAAMPLPDVRVTVFHGGCGPGGGACYQVARGGRHGDLILPDAKDYGYANERLLFLHELGHAFDYRHLDRRERNRFRAAVETPCSWWSKRCGPLQVPPGEMFAEMYASCARGWIRAEIDDSVFLTYGWLPPTGSDAAVCALIRSSV